MKNSSSRRSQRRLPVSNWRELSRKRGGARGRDPVAPIPNTTGAIESRGLSYRAENSSYVSSSWPDMRLGVMPKKRARVAATVTGVCTRERTIGARTKLAGRTARVATRKIDRDDMSERIVGPESMGGRGGEGRSRWGEKGRTKCRVAGWILRVVWCRHLRRESGSDLSHHPMWPVDRKRFSLIGQTGCGRRVRVMTDGPYT